MVRPECHPLLKKTLFSIVACILGLLVIEGLSSVALFLRHEFHRIGGNLSERAHSEFDERLGWVNTPNTRIENLYAPGKHITINSQGFRAKEDFHPSIPVGKLRIMCSGDSYTLGVGVDDGETWPAQLASLDSRIQTINMGQGGYGADQAYLWYLRDGARLQCQIHILALIPDDFQRMRYDTFLGYPKPILQVRDGGLVTPNTPLSRPSRLRIWWGLKGSDLMKLKTLEILSKAANRLFGRPHAPISSPQSDPSPAELMIPMLKSLKEINDKKNCALVLVYLPSSPDCRREPGEEWRFEILRQAKALGIVTLDAEEEMRKVPGKEAEKLFLTLEDVTVKSAWGHYSPEGNRFVAKSIYQKLLHVPALRRRLEGISGLSSEATPRISIQ